jgi:predicted RNA-binding Zn ribbon-like protein
MEAGDSPPAAFIKELNRLLIRHPAIDQVVKAESKLERRRRFEPEVPEDVFAPLADAMADLVTNVDRGRIRKCPACVLHFYDTSKKGTRTWCSMRMCGNRAKVAAFAERQRAVPTGIE